MVRQVAKHHLKWLAPSSLWNNQGKGVLEDQEMPFREPAILRFAHDAFMDELSALMQSSPEKLGQWLAQPETWREPMPTPKIASELNLNEPLSDFTLKFRKRVTGRERTESDSAETASKISTEGGSQTEPLPLKLYQPAHQRYYLVAASLVCRQYGLPDHQVDSGKQEQVSFVVRRLIHPDKKNTHVDPREAYDEHAFVMTPAGMMWRNITRDSEHKPGELMPQEERLPLFGINFPEEKDRKRRLLSGLIPVAKREAYLSATRYVSENGPDLDLEDVDKVPDPRKVLFISDVAAPWKALVEQAAFEKERLGEALSIQGIDQPSVQEIKTINNDLIKSSREQIQTASWYILLDFYEFLKRYLLNVWKLVTEQDQGNFSATDKEQKVFDALLKFKLTLEQDSNKPDLRDALKEFTEANIKKNLEEVDVLYEKDPKNENGSPRDPDPRWPSFLFPLADPVVNGPFLPQADLDAKLETINSLTDLIDQALQPPKPDEPMPETMMAAQPVLDSREPWFVIRCIYERPNCGPFMPPLVSEATRPFQMAVFFDPDAPARPIRIPMPLDISPAGLRKFKKNTGFVLSDMFCGKMDGFKKLTLADLVLSVLPWPFHKDLPDIGDTGPCKNNAGLNFGMVCSLSIPIVTICAFVLLMIIVALFDTIFRWIPFLISSFPIPGLRGKKT